MKNEIDEAILYEMERLDSLIEREALVRLAAELYEPTVGGFYYSLSAKNNEGFYPDIESTAQMLVTLTSLGLFKYSDIHTERFPDRFRDEITRFFLTRQDKETGFFFDTQFGKAVNESKKGRNTGQSLGRLSELGVKPLYPTPAERTLKKDGTESVLADHYKSLRAYRAWLDSLDWQSDDGHKQYYGANMISASRESIAAAGYLDYTREYLTEVQNKETGLWGKHLDSMAINAAMKVSGIFDDKYKYPNVDKMIASILKVVEAEEPYSVATLWNPLVLVRNILRNYGEMPDGLKDSIDRVKLPLIRISVDRLSRFKKPDGGCSYYPDRSSPTSQGVTVGLGLSESDANATMIGTASIRDTVYTITRLGDHKPLLSELNTLFFDEIERKRR